MSDDNKTDESEDRFSTDKSADQSIASAATDETEKWRKDYLYLRAEFENYKKNVIKERSDSRKYGAERLIIELLSTLDLLEAALALPFSPENIENLRKGVELTAHELRATLQRHGVEELPAHGVAFDPGIHEALSSEETVEVPAGHVARVFKKPYKLHDRVVRHGQVVVAKPRGERE